MNEKRIQELAEIEKRARALYESAIKEADRIPAEAEQEAEALKQTNRAAARKEAEDLITRAQADDVGSAVMAKAQASIREIEDRAAKNLERAIEYVLDHVAGAE